MINFQKLFNRLELNESEADRLKHLFHEMNNSSAIKDNECSDVIEKSQVLLSKWDGVIQREIKRHAKCCFSDEEQPIRWHYDVWKVYAALDRSGRFDMVINRYLPQEDDVRSVDRTWVETIDCAMRASPYRSTDMMKVMYVGDKWMLARGLVVSCVSEDWRVLALNHLETMRMKFGKERTMQMVEKDVVDCGSLKFLFSSAVSSYVADVICQWVIVLK